ncbi:unnamed protein product [Rangifer tarandus platyrhynchus]|uniref:Uncharacterized protein n=2 Tax=Rangifer tarandus platyrhynchus TaxID=3082113 RepID=A0AC59ZMR5_RANTA|nr:unnamed protein product [Rangifer tarandus platyrhynchus]
MKSPAGAGKARPGASARAPGLPGPPSPEGPRGPRGGLRSSYYVVVGPNGATGSRPGRARAHSTCLRSPSSSVSGGASQFPNSSPARSSSCAPRKPGFTGDKGKPPSPCSVVQPHSIHQEVIPQGKPRPVPGKPQ